MDNLHNRFFTPTPAKKGRYSLLSRDEFVRSPVQIASKVITSDIYNIQKCSIGQKSNNDYKIFNRCKSNIGMPTNVNMYII